jgi:hypothetical protein
VFALAAASCVLSCGGPKGDPRYPPRAEGCEVKVFRGEIPQSIAFNKLGRVDAICGNDIGETDCMRVLMNQACKVGGDMLYDMQPSRPSPDKVKWDARVAHTRIHTTTSP